MTEFPGNEPPPPSEWQPYPSQEWQPTTPPPPPELHYPQQEPTPAMPYQSTAGIPAIDAYVSGAPPRKRRRKALILALVALIVAGGLGVGGWLVFKKSSPHLTYRGMPIDGAKAALTTAESYVDKIVQTRHGAQNGDTRCYFTRPRHPAAGVDKDDVDSAVRCGPVLFVDGDKTRTFLTFSFVYDTTKDGDVTITPSPVPATPDPGTVSPDTDLVRPDGKQPPNPIDLAVPQPPVADANAFVASDLGPITEPAEADTQMVSLHTGVKVGRAGAVSRYGHGDEARSAPPGKELIAFQLADVQGEATSSPSGKYVRLVDASGSHKLPELASSDEYVVIAEPVAATIKLVLTDGGYTQTITLPDGKPGAHNLTVLTRTHRNQIATKKSDVTVRASGPGGSISVTLHATYRGAYLDYWPANFPKDHPAKTGDAYLHVALTFTSADAVDPKKPYGFDPKEMVLKLPNGKTIHAKDISKDPKFVYNVFEVPASFTKGTVVITGTDAFEGVTTTITPVKFPVSIAAD